MCHTLRHTPHLSNVEGVTGAGRDHNGLGPRRRPIEPAPPSIVFYYFSVLQWVGWRCGGRSRAAGTGIGRAHARHVMSTVEPIEVMTAGGNPALESVGLDDRGVELEIVAAVLPDLYRVVHVMPTALRS